MNTQSPTVNHHFLLTVAEVARECRVCPRTVRRWYTGPDAILTPIKLSRTVRFKKSDVDKLLGRTESEFSNNPAGLSAFNAQHSQQEQHSGV